jgi:hypothetical protein
MVQINHKEMKEPRINPLISSVQILIKMNRMFQKVTRLTILRRLKSKKMQRKRKRNRMKSSLLLKKLKNPKSRKKKARQMKIVMV